MYKKKQTVNYPKKAMVANPGFKQLRKLDFQIYKYVFDPGFNFSKNTDLELFQIWISKGK